MSTTLPAEGTDISTLPPATVGGPIPGLYIVELLSIKAAGKSKFPNKQGIYEDQAAVTWKIRKVLDTEHDDPDSLVGTTITRYPTFKMSKRANLRKWFEAHANRELEIGEQPDAKEVLNTLAKMHIAQEQGDNGLETHITLTPYVKPSKEAKATKPAPKPASAPEPDDDPEGFRDDDDELDF